MYTARSIITINYHHEKQWNLSSSSNHHNSPWPSHCITLPNAYHVLNYEILTSTTLHNTYVHIQHASACSQHIFLCFCFHVCQSLYYAFVLIVFPWMTALFSSFYLLLIVFCVSWFDILLLWSLEESGCLKAERAVWPRVACCFKIDVAILGVAVAV